jgi:hypothetical protein
VARIGIDSSNLRRALDVAQTDTPDYDEAVSGALARAFGAEAYGFLRLQWNTHVPTIDSRTFSDPVLERAWTQFAVNAPRPQLAEVLSAASVKMTSELPLSWPGIEAQLIAGGLSDALILQAYDPDGTGVLFGFAYDAKLELARTDRRLLSHLMPRLTSYRRARNRKTVHSSREGQVAGLQPEEHAQVRHALAANAPLRALTIEEQLVTRSALDSGRWTVVSQLEHGDDEYLVIRDNAPNAAIDADELSALDKNILLLRARGHSLKSIAFELGISTTRASRSLSRARVTLGHATEASLLRAVRQGLQLEAVEA